jgi:polar amino acid transport system substrate-binding protein
MGRWFALLALGLFLPAAASDPLPGIIVSIPEHHPLIGFVGDDLGEAYRRIGLRMLLKPFPPARSIEAANAGETDAEAGRVRETGGQYANLLEVPVPLLDMEIQAVTAAEPLTLSGWDSLKGHRICVGLGDKLAERRTAGMDRQLARGPESAVLMLRSGRCDVAIITQFTWLDIGRLNLGPLCPASGSLEKVPLYHYVHRRHADLVPRLTDVLQSMRQDGATDHAWAPIQAQIEQAKVHSASCGAIGAAPR